MGRPCVSVLLRDRPSDGAALVSENLGGGGGCGGTVVKECGGGVLRAGYGGRLVGNGCSKNNARNRSAAGSEVYGKHVRLLALIETAGI